MLIGPFLKAENSYRYFSDLLISIGDLSTVAAPLTSLTSPDVKVVWSQEADAAFFKPKHLFTSAPVLVHPDPLWQFVVEVDDLDTGVGAVISQ